MTGSVQRYVAAHDLLLVLDNCEHVLDACADLTVTLLGACRTLGVLTTSREPLGIAGETVWRLDPLPPEYAYRLFMERARERSPYLVPDAALEAVVLEICSRVDGLPLGIELAAARVSVMTPHEIIASLGAHLGELGRAPRRSPVHHRSVRAAVGWSHQLLDPVEQAAFRSLAVFVGGFDAEAARAVAPGMSLDVLARLVDKSLITVVPSGAGRTRYRLLDTVRTFASERLTEAGEVDDARTRHLQFFTAIGIPVEAGWMSARVAPLLEERAADYANVRAAAEWAAATQPCLAVRLLAETKDLFFMQGQADGSRLAELVLSRCPDRSRHRAELMIAAGHFAYLLGATASANRLMTEAAELGVELGERSVEGTAHWFLGLHQMFSGPRDRARGHLVTARAIQQETGDGLGEARTTAALGLSLWMDDKPREARELLQDALAIGRSVRDRWSQGQANLYLGILAESTDDLTAASGFFSEAVECLRPYRDSTLLPVALVGQARVMTRRDPVTALKLVAAAWAARARNGGEFAPFYRTYAERTLAGATAGVSGDADRLWTEGMRLTVDDAAALAFGRARPPATHALGISNREIDVVWLIADGLSNKEIAATLHLSVRTVESHVRHALTKTGLLNRTQLATWARDRGARESVLPPRSH
jgi:non-specific serine/threonine protein kinase